MNEVKSALESMIKEKNEIVLAIPELNKKKEELLVDLGHANADLTLLKSQIRDKVAEKDSLFQENIEIREKTEEDIVQAKEVFAKWKDQEEDRLDRELEEILGREDKLSKDIEAFRVEYQDFERRESSLKSKERSIEEVQRANNEQKKTNVEEKSLLESQKIEVKQALENAKKHQEGANILLLEAKNKESEVNKKAEMLQKSISEFNQSKVKLEQKIAEVDRRIVVITKKEQDLRLRELRLTDREQVLESNLSLMK